MAPWQLGRWGAHKVADIARASMSQARGIGQVSRYVISKAHDPAKIANKMYNQAQVDLDTEILRKRNITLCTLASLQTALAKESATPLSPAPHSDTTDGTSAKKREADGLCKKLSVFTTFLLLRYAFESSKLEKDREMTNDSLFELTHTAMATGGSIWSLFTRKYKMGLIQTLKVGFLYWAVYKTSIIHNTIEAYVDAFLTDLQKQLSENQSKVFHNILENANQFLIEDLRATKAFADGKEAGDLTQYRRKAIEALYHGVLTTVFAQASQTQIKRLAPEIKILSRFHDLPIIGYVSHAFQRCINHFIIRKIMTTQILPLVFSCTVQSSFEATQPRSLPFRTGLTKYFSSQLALYNIQLEKNPQNGHNTATPVLRGTELLPTVVKNLRALLPLEPCHTASEIKEKMRELANPSWLPLEQTIETTLDKALIEGGHLFFHYLKETMASDELFARVLKDTSSIFDKPTSSASAQTDEYNTACDQFWRTSNMTAELLAESGVKEAISEYEASLFPKPDNLKTEQAFSKWKKSARLISEHLVNQTRGFSESWDPLHANAEQEIGSLLKVMETWASMDLKSIELLTPFEKDLLWRSIHPLYSQAEALEKTLSKAQEQLYQFIDDRRSQEITIEKIRAEIRENTHDSETNTKIIETIASFEAGRLSEKQCKATLRAYIEQFHVGSSEKIRLKGLELQNGDLKNFCEDRRAAIAAKLPELQGQLQLAEAHFAAFHAPHHPQRLTLMDTLKEVSQESEQLKNSVDQTTIAIGSFVEPKTIRAIAMGTAIAAPFGLAPALAGAASAMTLESLLPKSMKEKLYHPMAWAVASSALIWQGSMDLASGLAIGAVQAIPLLKKGVTHHFKTRVHKKVQALLEQGHALALSPRLYEALGTRTFVALGK